MRSNVKKIMEEKGVAILPLAQKAGVSQRTIQKARDGRIESCTLKTLDKLATALDCKVKDLFEETSAPKWLGK